MNTEQKHGNEVREALREVTYWHARARLVDSKVTEAHGGPWEACIARKKRLEAMVEMKRHVLELAEIKVGTVLIEFCVAIDSTTDADGTTTINSPAPFSADVLRLIP